MEKFVNMLRKHLSDNQVIEGFRPKQSSAVFVKEVKVETEELVSGKTLFCVWVCGRIPSMEGFTRRMIQSVSDLCDVDPSKVVFSWYGNWDGYQAISFRFSK